MLAQYIVVDLEMTGVHAKNDSITEIGAVKVTEHRTETFQTLVKPRTRISREIEKLTGITNEMVESAPSPKEAMTAFLEFAADLPLVGHMITCDYAFLKQAAVNCGLPFERQGLDTLKISRACLPELESHTLDYLTEYYDIPREMNHRALQDALATNVLYRAMATEFEETHEKDFRLKQLNYHAKKQTPATVQQLRYLKRYCEMMGAPLPEGMEGFTRSEASRVTDKLIEKYGKLPKQNEEEGEPV